MSNMVFSTYLPFYSNWVKAKREFKRRLRMKQSNNSWSNNSRLEGKPWEETVDKDTIRLAMIILLHLFYSDDRSFSRLEKIIFKNQVRSIHEFNQVDKDQLYNTLNQRVDMNYIINYINQNNMKEQKVLSSFSVVKCIKLQERYLETLRKLEEGYRNYQIFS